MCGLPVTMCVDQDRRCYNKLMAKIVVETVPDNTWTRKEISDFLAYHNQTIFIDGMPYRDADSICDTFTKKELLDYVAQNFQNSKQQTRKPSEASVVYVTYVGGGAFGIIPTYKGEQYLFPGVRYSFDASNEDVVEFLNKRVDEFEVSYDNIPKPKNSLLALIRQAKNGEETIDIDMGGGMMH